MYQDYFFMLLEAQIGLCRKGYETVYSEMFGSFLLDETVTGIALKPAVVWHLCDYKKSDDDSWFDEDLLGLTDRSEIDAYARAHRHTVRMRIVMHKESDCDEFNKAVRIYRNQNSLFDSASGSIRMNDAFKEMAAGICMKNAEKIITQFNSKAVAQAEFDYCMPADIEEYDYPIIVLPLKAEDVEPGVAYRLSILSVNQDFEACDKMFMPSAKFYKYDKPLTQVFIPQSASIRVKQRINGKYPFASAKKYRNYSNFSSEIHFESGGGDVEGNPALACVELKMPGGVGDDLPVFQMSFSHNGQPINKSLPERPVRQLCRFAKQDRTTVVICCPLRYNDFRLPKGTITARLMALGICIAEFEFSTAKTEPGEIAISRSMF